LVHLVWHAFHARPRRRTQAYCGPSGREGFLVALAATARAVVMKLDLPKAREFHAGVWYSTPFSTFYPTHYHDELEVNLALLGQARVRIGRSVVHLLPGTQLWLAPGQPHALESVSSDFSMWVLSFRPGAVLSAQKRTGVEVLTQRPRYGVCQLPSSRLRELSALCSEQVTLQHPRQSNPLVDRFLTLALRAWHDRHAVTEGGAASAVSVPHPAVAHAVSLLRRPNAHLTLQGISTACRLSATRLSRLFNEQVGLSIAQFRNHVRVQSFILTYGRGEGWNMLEAALQAGFGSYPQFFRAFRQVTGYAPGEHLQRVQSGIVTPVSIGTALGVGKSA
jgi:AraC-like DNA-binding protein